MSSQPQIYEVDEDPVAKMTVAIAFLERFRDLRLQAANVAHELSALLGSADALKADAAIFQHCIDVLRSSQLKVIATEPCVRECETCDGPLPPLDEWSMPSCPECVNLADERNELISELENISSYEAGAAQDIIKRAIAALRDDRTAPPPKPNWGLTPTLAAVRMALDAYDGDEAQTIQEILETLRPLRENARLDGQPGSRY